MFLFLLLLVSTTHALPPPSERNALLDFYGECNHTGWPQRDNWGDAAVSVCEWSGVDCDEKDSHVAAIKIDTKGPMCALPTSMAQLTAMVAFHFTNGLQGPFPAAFQEMPLIEKINIAPSRIEGTLPAWVADLKMLRSLRVSYQPDGGDTPWPHGLRSPLPDLGRSGAMVDLNLDMNFFEEDVLPGWVQNLTFASFEGSVFEGPCPEPAWVKGLPGTVTVRCKDKDDDDTSGHIGTTGGFIMTTMGLTLIGTIMNVFTLVRKVKRIKQRQ